MIAEVLQRLGAAHANGYTLVELIEHEERSCFVPRGHLEEVFTELCDRFAHAIDKNLVEISAVCERSGGAKVVISTGSNVGFASGTRDLFVRVLPKVGAEQMLNLAMSAQMIPAWSPGGARVSPILDQALIEWTIGSFESALRRFLARGGLRNTHENVRGSLQGRIKGRLLVGPWVRNAVRGAPHVVPCSFPSLEIDNPANRYLMWATHVALAASRRLPSRQLLESRLRQLQRQLSGISLAKPGRSIDVKCLPPSLRHYTEVLVAAEMIVAAINLGSSPGELESMAISIDMNVVYELAFYNELRELVPSACRHKEWRVMLKSEAGASRSTLMIPDIFVPGPDPDTVVLIDTKWKAPRKGGTDEAQVSASDSKTIRMQPSDLYQVTSYAIEALERLQERGVRRCLGVLVYPSLRDVPSFERLISIGDRQIILRVVGWNISAPVSNEIKRVWQVISSVTNPRRIDEIA